MRIFDWLGGLLSTQRAPSVRSWVTRVFCLVGICSSTAALAQTLPGGLSGQGGDGGQPGLAPGGAAMADFDTLMNLIQQTIDPDSWLANGGTSTILPYPAGVYVDPQGHLQRVRPAEQLDRSLVAGQRSPQTPWQTPSGLRTLSLRRLDEALTNARRSGLSPSLELQKLGGLKKIDYVQIDPEGEDILIAGPAGDSLYGFELQDVAVVAARINQQTTPLGCSIEPTTAGLRTVQEFVQSPATARTLARNPRLIAEQMQDKIGAHEVKVFGLPANTGTAIALIDADEHMKKVGFGTAPTPVRINSYFDYLDRQGGAVPKQSLIRWWFAFADEPIKANASGDLFQLPEQCVAVLSEQQWVTQLGRVPSGGNDPAADAFAAGMTTHLEALRSSHASYARLHAVFELSLALQLAVEATGQPDLKAWLPTLCSLGAASSAAPAPRTVSGLTTWHKLQSGTVVAVVSGGVEINAARLASRDSWQDSKFLASSLVPARPEVSSPVHGSWWWDAP